MATSEEWAAQLRVAAAMAYWEKAENDLLTAVNSGNVTKEAVARETRRTARLFLANARASELAVRDRCSRARRSAIAQQPFQ